MTISKETIQIVSEKNNGKTKAKTMETYKGLRTKVQENMVKINKKTKTEDIN